MDDVILSASAKQKKDFVVAEYTPRNFGYTRWWSELELDLSQGQDKKVLSALKRRDVLSALDQNGNTPLHYAAKANNVTVARYLLKAGCDVDKKNIAGIPALAIAVAHDSLGVVELLLNAGANCEVDFYEYNFGLLHIAAYGTSLECLDALLGAGLQWSDADCDGWTPLHVAMEFDRCRENARNGDFVNKIIGSKTFKSAVSEARCNNGRSALDYASFRGYCGGIEQLLNAGAKVSRKSGGHRTPLHFAAYAHELGAARLLIEAGADVNAIATLEMKNYTVLEYACYAGYERVLNMSLMPWNRDSRDANVRCLKDLWRKQLDTAEFLIEAGANVKLCCKSYTHLHYACLSINYSLIKFLLDIGVDAGQSNFIWWCSLSPILRGYGGAGMSFDESIEQSRGRELVEVQIDCIKLLMSKGVRLKFGSYTYLRTAILSNHSEVVRLLLQSGATCNIDRSDDFYLSTMKWRPDACREVIKHVVKMLSRGGAPMDFPCDLLTKELRDFHAECTEELELAKKVLCWSQGTITYYNLLTDRDVTALARNRSIVLAIKAPNVEKRFPIYSRELLERFAEAKKRQKLVDGAAKAFCRLKRVNGYPLVLDNIFKYLSDPDLEALSLA